MITVQKKQITILLMALMFSGFIRKVGSEPLSTSVTISGRVIVPTCAFEDNLQEITLPDVLRSDFGNNNLAGDTPLTIKISSCDPDQSKLKIRFEGVKGGADTTFINTGTAEGYSLALFTSENNEPVYDGVTLDLPLQQGAGKIDMVAKYQVHSTNPVSGTFKSTVNVLLEYR